MIAKVYSNNQNTDKVLNHYENQLKAPKVALRESFSSPKYKYGSFVAVSLVVFNELLGHKTLLLYSTEFLKMTAAFSDKDNFV